MKYSKYKCVLFCNLYNISLKGHDNSKACWRYLPHTEAHNSRAQGLISAL